MDILKDLQNMIDKSSAFAKRNEIELRGNGRDFSNVYIIPEIKGVSMSSDELADVLQLKESYIRSHWPRIVESYEKQNIKLYKLGRGAAANYGVQMPWDNEIVWSVDALEMMG